MTWRRWRAALVVACLSAFCLAPGPAHAAGITNGGSDLRDGWYGSQPALSPEVVGGTTFGQLWSQAIDGQIYAQPLVHAGHVLVASERNRVASFDAETGAPAWSLTLPHGTPFNPDDVTCTDLTPDIGVTATPVIDPATNTMYLTHKSYVSGTSGPAAWWMDALDTTTGAERPGFPVRLQGEAQNVAGRMFNATMELQRPGLLLLDGVVYVAFGGHCDRLPYQGWVMGVSTAGQITARWVALRTGDGAGIWQSGSGLMSDGPGRIFLATGNGGSPVPPLAGTSPDGQFGESIVRLAVQPDGSLKAADFFAPYDAAHLDDYDADFASGGVTALRDQYFGSALHPHLAVAVGKAGYVYLLDRDDLGGIGTGLNGGDRTISRTGPRGGVWSRPGVWPGDGGWVIVPTASGMAADDFASASSGTLDYYRYGTSGSGQPSLAFRAQSDDGFGLGASAPIITSDGTTSGSALVWTTWAPGGYGTGAQLRAYDAVPTADGHLRLRFAIPVGRSSKFAMPGVGNGRIYVGTREGKVIAFGAPVQAKVQAPTTAFGVTTVGQSTTKSVELTITAPLKITSITAGPSPFGADASGIDLAQTFAAGAKITLPVTFAPTTPGGAGGSITVVTDQGTFSFGLTGTGQAVAALLTATPPTVSFGGAKVGSALDQTVTFGNGGGQPLTVTAVDGPDAPFTLDGLPAVGATIAPGGHIDVAVHYTPVTSGADADELTLTTTAGAKTIGLSGTAGTGGLLSVTPVSGWAFGDVAVGASVTQSVMLANVGDTALKIMKSKPPVAGPFTVGDELPEGTTLPPGATRTLHATFAPVGVGAVTGEWTVTADDGSGVHAIALTGRGTAVLPVPATPDPVVVDPGTASAVLAAPVPAPALGGPVEAASVFPAKLGAGLAVARLGVAGRDLRRLTIVGLSSPWATGTVRFTVAVRTPGRRTLTVNAARLLRGGRFVVHLTLPRTARSWRSLTVTARFGGNARVSAGVAARALVLAH